AMLQQLASLAASFDLVVTDFSAPELAQGDLLTSLEPWNPAIVVANADHFGRHGPYAGWTGDELTDYAMGGYWSLAGDPTREPLRVPGYQAQFHAGMQLALAALAAARHAKRTGQGQEVESTGVESMLGAHWSTTVAWAHEGRVITRAGSDVFPAADGWVFFYQMAFYPNLLVLIDRLDLMDDPRWHTIPAWLANGHELWALAAEWCKDKTVEEIVFAAQELRIPVTPVENAERLLADEVLAERGFFREVGGHALPGRPTKWGENWAFIQPSRLVGLLQTPPNPRRLAPLRTATARAKKNPGAALSGLRVLELTNNWAGPIAGRHMADLGAEVIKIELATKPATRASHDPAKIPGKYHWNRSGYFNEMNRNKRGLSLNLATERGRELFLRLAEQSDVVIENNSARVMPNLDVGYDTLKTVNSKLIMASISGFGATGARRDWVAFGSNVEAASGLAAITGYDGGVPYRTGSFVADPIGGAQAVVAVLAALARRDRTGQGCHIDVSLVEATLPFMLLGFSHLQSTGSLLASAGNGEPWDAPTGAYPTGINDDWIAIAVRTDEQYAALARLAELEPATAGREDRVRQRSMIDAQLSAWTRTFAQMECVRLLQSAGIPAAPILHNWQLHSDPHLFHRQAFIHIEHPDTGVFPYPGYPWDLSRTPPALRNAAPQFGEGNRYVFSHLLRLDDSEIDALYAEGVTTDQPVGMPSFG
ncbi:MAG: CoA transferase, partial [Tepidiformaceae bacterium]